MTWSQKALAGITVSVTALSLSLVGCGRAPQAAPAEDSPVTDTGTNESTDFSIEDVDFTALEWSLAHIGRMIPTDGLSFDEGPAIIETVEYTLDPDGIIYSDADGDGDLDAIVPVSALDVVGGDVDLGTAWYLWSDVGGQVEQVRVPAALSNCDTVVDSVTAVDGGFEITEFHLRSGEESYTACGDPGSDERTRTVVIAAHGEDGELWPAQTAPFASFGGACPVSIAFHGDPATADHFPAPHEGSDPLAGDQINTWPVEEWQIFRDGYPGWELVGVNVDGSSGCAWSQL